MNNLFKKRMEKQTRLEEILENDVNNYIYYMRCLYQANGLTFKSEDKENLVEEFWKARSYFKEYMESTFSDEVLSDGACVEIDDKDMLNEADDGAKRLFRRQKYSRLIYIDCSDSFPHIHTDGEVVIEAEGMYALEGLDNILKTPKINSIFNGLTIEEMAALLEQMGILPKQGELRQAILTHRILENINALFKRDIIYALLDSKSEERVVRARLFADTYQIPFEFGSYEEELSKDRSLKKKKDC